MPATEKVFHILDVGDAPERGLFFVDRRAPPVELFSDATEEERFATGMAFLISQDGILATCAHVILAMGRSPGERIRVFGAAPQLPISIEADVLERGWRGPSWHELLEHYGHRRRDWLRIVDARPDIFREDFALLKLDAPTARWDESRGGVPPTRALEHLLQTARVLPLGIPGYRHHAGTPLKAWHVAWEITKIGAEEAVSYPAVPHTRAGEGRFRGLEPGLHNAIRFTSDNIKPGYSGSPLFDEGRHRVVGMVRRGTRSTADAVLGVDARKIAEYSEASVLEDPAAQALYRVVTALAENTAPLKHFPVLRGLLPPSLIELKVRPAFSRDVLVGRDESEERLRSAKSVLLEQISLSPVVFVSGGAGAGKSTLIYILCRHFLQETVLVNGRRILPVPITAKDFHTFGWDVPKLLAEQFQRSIAREDVEDAILLNDLAVLFLIDGLDEIDPKMRAKVIGALSALRRNPRDNFNVPDAERYRVLVATRPVDDIEVLRHGTTRQEFPVFNLVHPNAEDIQHVAKQWFDNEDDQQRFQTTLADVEWDSRGPTPLQLAMARALVGLPEGLAKRPIDLVFVFVDHLLTHREGAAETVVDRRLGSILECIADEFVGGSTTRGQLIGALKKQDNELASAAAAFLESRSMPSNGLCSYGDETGDGDHALTWPHRTIAEALAARHCATRNKYHQVRAISEFGNVFRSRGQYAALLSLAAADGSDSGQVAVNRFLAQCLEQSGSEYKRTLFAVRALGAGIRTSTEVRRRLLGTLVTLLLVKPGAAFGLRCEDVFSTDDLPDPVEIATRVRGELAEHLSDRWRQKLVARQKRGLAGPYPLSEREALMLDRLKLWGDVDLPIERPSGLRTIGRAMSSLDLPSHGGAHTSTDHVAGAIVSTALLELALERLRQDTQGFLTGFAKYVAENLHSTDPRSMAYQYLQKTLEHSSSPSSSTSKGT